MRLIVCIDRDDDLGRKAGVAGPVVGRAAVLAAAERLGLADPGDTDTNAMFGALQLYDELSAAAETVEVVVLTGSGKVGHVSDRKVADQFDRVLRDHPAGSAILVSDGAEDEFLVPVLASRVRIDAVQRIHVRQSPSLESTYYTVLAALKDPKFRHKTVLPAALVSITFAIAAAAGLIWWGFVALLFLLGIYLVFWTFDIDEAIIEALRSASSDIRQGSVAFGFGLLSIALGGVGFLEGYNVDIGLPAAEPIARALLFVRSGLVWWFLASMIWESGRALRRYFSTGRFGRGYPVATVSIMGLAFISYGIVSMIQALESLPSALPLPFIVGGLILGFVLMGTAGLLLRMPGTTPETPPPSTGSPPLAT